MFSFRAALVRTVGVSEVDVDPGSFGDLGVAGHLGAAVPGQGLGEPGRERAHLLRHRGGDSDGVVTVRQVHQGQVAAVAFDDGADRRSRGLRADDQVALMVAGDLPALDLGGPVMDRDRVHDLAPALDPSTASSLGSSGPQLGLQLPGELTAGVDEEALVDRLRAPDDAASRRLTHMPSLSGCCTLSRPDTCSGE